MIQLTQKEKSLLEDQKKHEQICIEKYTNYANQTQSPQLKQLLQSYAAQEQNHYDTINQILSGQVPNLNQGQQQGMTSSNAAQSATNMQGAMADQSDASRLNDLLMTEKYVSSTYDTAIFEFTDSNVRQALNHIQKEEQQHGEGIFNYMQSHGMYNPS
jgi:spore coat protein CotF